MDRVLQALALLPMRAGNALRGPAPPGLAAPVIFGAMARAALRLYLKEQEGGHRDETGWRAFWGPFVHKTCKMGQAVPLARAWVEEAAADSSSSSSSSGSRRRRSLAPLVDFLPLPALEPFLVAVVRTTLLLPSQTQDAAARQRALLHRGFGEVLQQSLQLSPGASPSVVGQALRALIVSKLLVTGAASTASSSSSSSSSSTSKQRLLPRQAAPLLLRLAAGGDDDDVGKALPPLLLALARPWKERRFIRTVDAAQQAFVTHALVAGLGMVAAGGGKSLEVRKEGGMAGVGGSCMECSVDVDF